MESVSLTCVNVAPPADLSWVPRFEYSDHYVESLFHECAKGPPGTIDIVKVVGRAADVHDSIKIHQVPWRLLAHGAATTGKPCPLGACLGSPCACGCVPMDSVRLTMLVCTARPQAALTARKALPRSISSVIAICTSDAGRLSRALNVMLGPTPVAHPALPGKAAPGQLSAIEIEQVRSTLGLPANPFSV